MVAELTAFTGAVARAEAHSPFLRSLIARYPDIVAVASTSLVAALAIADLEPDAPVPRRLRLWRARTMLAIALADLAGAEPFETLTACLSDFADAALNIALKSLVPAYEGFAVIALGKHGSRELNYSSDLDPVLIFDPTCLPRRPREESGEAAVRIARRLVELMQSREDGLGIVFRIDLRLRPASEATPLAIPVDAAIQHYESNALPWERAAYIRGRAAAGDVALGQRFLKAIQPFVWRRNLDFGAVGELRALTRAIRDHHGSAPVGPGYDVKRGRGGIREVEFYTQIHQLIHGGRDVSLRAPATLDGLAALATAGWIDPVVAARLADAYRRLRTVEHRLQLIDDRQTHLLPGGDELAAVAALGGVGVADLLGELEPLTRFVEATYDALDEGQDEQSPLRGSALAEHLATSGYVEVDAAAECVARWRAGGIRAVRSPAAIAAFEALLPDLLTALGQAPDPDVALARIDALLTRLSSGVNLFRMLAAQPGMLQLVVRIVAHAPMLADALASRPALLDRLVDPGALGELPDLAELILDLTEPVQPVEWVLDRVRHIVGEQRFALGTRLIAGDVDPLVIAAGYGRLAEAAVTAVAKRLTDEFVGMHGRVPASELVILALGRLGGGLMTHASDLDVIFLYTGDSGSVSDGTKSLSASLYYNRLAQRIIGGLSAPTSVGALYAVDTRLRPSGTQGPLCVPLGAFERYQRESAWTWEHMALTRARVVHGSREARQAVGDVLRAVLSMRRTADIVRDAVAMRAEIAVHKPPQGPLDVKLAPGGLVDLEFVVHCAQLTTGIGVDPDLRVAIDRLARAGILDPALRESHDRLTRLLVVLRLVAPTLAEPDPATRDLVASVCGADDWNALLAQTTDARHVVSRAWHRVVAESGQ